jgi:hypothetical protein
MVQFARGEIRLPDSGDEKSLRMGAEYALQVNEVKRGKITNCRHSLGETLERGHLQWVSRLCSAAILYTTNPK